MKRERDTLETKGAENVTMTNCTFDWTMWDADGMVEEKHQRLNPKTMKWEDWKRAKRKR